MPVFQEWKKVLFRRFRSFMSENDNGKRAVNRAWEVAGFRSAMEANTELDALIETADLPQRAEFRRITKERGLKAAIAWRDARFRGEDA